MFVSWQKFAKLDFLLWIVVLLFCDGAVILMKKKQFEGKWGKKQRGRLSSAQDHCAHPEKQGKPRDPAHGAAELHGHVIEMMIIII